LSPFSNKRYNNPDSHSANNSTNNINTKDNYREINVKKVKGKMEGNEGMSTNYLNPVPVYNCNDNAYPTTQNQVIINSNLNVEHSHLHPYNSINTNKTSSLSISNSHGPSSRRMTELELSLSEDQNNHCVSNNNSNKNNDKSGIGTQYITNNGLFTSFNSSSFNNTALIHNSSNNNININNNSSDKGMQMSVGSSEYHVNSSVDIHYLNRGNPTDDGNNPS
jgi:hypothetical protein